MMKLRTSRSISPKPGKSLSIDLGEGVHNMMMKLRRRSVSPKSKSCFVPFGAGSNSIVESRIAFGNQLEERQRAVSSKSKSSPKQDHRSSRRKKSKSPKRESRSSKRSKSPKQQRPEKSKSDPAVAGSSNIMKQQLEGNSKSPTRTKTPPKSKSVDFGEVRVRAHERVLVQRPSACYASLGIGWAHIPKSDHFTLEDFENKKLEQEHIIVEQDEEERKTISEDESNRMSPKTTTKKRISNTTMIPHNHTHHKDNGDQALVQKPKDHERLEVLTKYGFTPREVLKSERVKQIKRNEDFFASSSLNADTPLQPQQAEAKAA